jgi:predicted HicB family RNase H-like nuclease
MRDKTHRKITLRFTQEKFKELEKEAQDMNISTNALLKTKIFRNAG